MPKLQSKTRVSHLGSRTKKYTLQGTNISPKNGILTMIFLFPRWDMLIPWRAYIYIYTYMNDISPPSPALPYPATGFFYCFCQRGFHRKNHPQFLKRHRSLLRNQESDIPSTVPRGVVCISPANCSLLNGNPQVQ